MREMSNKVSIENVDDVTSPYNLFKYSITTKLTTKYYEKE